MGSFPETNSDPCWLRGGVRSEVSQKQIVIHVGLGEG